MVNNLFNIELKEYVQSSKLVQVKSLANNMNILKYKRKVFYDGLWDQYLEQCRGTIVDDDFNLISYPFTKIYNYQIEKQAPIFDVDQTVTAFDKINGFMAAITIHNDELLISTTGSISSSHVDYVKDIIAKTSSVEDWKNHLLPYKDHTFMFECVHELDPHIIKEKVGLYLLAYRKNIWNSEIEYNSNKMKELSSKLNCFQVCQRTIKLSDLIGLSKHCTHEGFVFYDQDKNSSKIKSLFYLVSKWMSRNPDTSKLNTVKFKLQIDEEYYPLLDHILADIEGFTLLDEQQRLEYIRDYFNGN